MKTGEMSRTPRFSSIIAGASMTLVLLACSQGESAEPPRANATIDGQSVYSAHCASCHDGGADGAPKLGDQADWAARVPEWTALLEEHASAGFINMPPIGGSGVLSREAVSAAAAYMAGAVKPTAATGLNQDLSAGRTAYAAYCASCHDRGEHGAPRLGDDAAWANRAPFWESVLRSHVENGFIAMPARGGRSQVKDQDVAAAIEYMMSWESIP